MKIHVTFVMTNCTEIYCKLHHGDHDHDNSIFIVAVKSIQITPIKQFFPNLRKKYSPEMDPDKGPVELL